MREEARSVDWQCSQDDDRCAVRFGTWQMKLWKLLSAALMLWFAGNYFGFCFSQFRFLSDDQRKEFAAMLAYRHTTKQTVLTKDHRRIKIPAAYSSFADFMTKNPKCCEIQDPVVRWP